MPLCWEGVFFFALLENDDAEIPMQVPPFSALKDVVEQGEAGQEYEVMMIGWPPLVSTFRGGMVPEVDKPKHSQSQFQAPCLVNAGPIMLMGYYYACYSCRWCSRPWTPTGWLQISSRIRV